MHSLNQIIPETKNEADESLNLTAHKDKHVKLNYSLCNVGMDSGMEIECRWNIVIISNSDKFAGYLSFVNRAGAPDPF